MEDGFSKQTQLNFATFVFLLPNSSLIKQFQYSVFGFSLPKSFTQSHLQPPINPFEPLENYKQIVQQIYRVEPSGDEMLTLQQYHDLFGD